MKLKPSFCLFTLCIALVGTPMAFGCMCAPPLGANTVRQLAEWQDKNANIAFEGTVEKQEVKARSVGAPANALSMTSNGAHRVVTVRVLHAYKGLSENHVTLLTGMGTGDCGFDFQTGHDYLIYGERLPTGELFTSICTGTTDIEEAGPAIRFLRGAPAAPDDLLNVQTYYAKRMSNRTGTVCGYVTKPDGTPLAKANVEMTELRDEPLPPYSAADENLSKPDGGFCVTGLRPGKYLLTADDYDYDANKRWMAYYPGKMNRAEASTLQIASGTRIPDANFTVHQQSLYTVRFRIVSSNGNPVPVNNLGIAIDNPDRDALAYHESHGVEEDGSYTLGLIPPGHYVVSTYLEPDFQTESIPAAARQWQMAKREVEINSNAEVLLTLTPAK